MKSITVYYWYYSLGQKRDLTHCDTIISHRTEWVWLKVVWVKCIVGGGHAVSHENGQIDTTARGKTPSNITKLQEHSFQSCPAEDCGVYVCLLCVLCGGIYIVHLFNMSCFHLSAHNVFLNHYYTTETKEKWKTFINSIVSVFCVLFHTRVMSCHVIDWFGVRVSVLGLILLILQLSVSDRNSTCSGIFVSFGAVERKIHLDISFQTHAGSRVEDLKSFLSHSENINRSHHINCNRLTVFQNLIITINEEMDMKYSGHL